MEERASAKEKEYNKKSLGDNDRPRKQTGHFALSVMAYPWETALAPAPVAATVAVAAALTMEILRKCDSFHLVGEAEKTFGTRRATFIKK